MINGKNRKNEQKLTKQKDKKNGTKNSNCKTRLNTVKKRIRK